MREGEWGWDRERKGIRGEGRGRGGDCSCEEAGPARTAGPQDLDLGVTSTTNMVCGWGRLARGGVVQRGKGGGRL